MTLTTRRAGLAYVDGLRGLRLAFELFFLIMIVVFAAIGFGIYLAGEFGSDTQWSSVWEQAMYGSRYFPLSMGIVLLAGFLPVATAHGVTRTSFVIGSTGLILTMAASVAVFLAVGQWIEYVLFNRAGAAQEYSSPHLYGSGTEVGWVLVESMIVVTINILGGFLIGAAFHRWGWLRATLFLPVLVVPILAVEVMISSGWVGNLVIDIFEVDRGPLGVVIPASVAVIAVTAVAALAIVRSSDVRTARG